MGANAQTKVPTFAAAEVLTAANQNLLSNGIPVFSGTATRDAAFGGSGEKTLAEGQFAFLEDSNSTQFYDGAAWQAVAGGKLGQVVSTTKTDTFTMASATYTDVTGLSLSITPTSATSKILLIASVVGGGQSAATQGYGQFVRDSTAIGVGDAAGSRVQATFDITLLANGYSAYSMGASFLDSPATTSATTYKIQVRREQATGTIYINRSEIDENSGSGGRFVSTITALEILA
jgi:hypothetical protein